ncbi:MAG: redoxin family protein [Salibacteraceae bacterium]
MGFIKKQWQGYKAKSWWAKFTDVLFIAFIAVMISSDGRVFFQRIVLQTGLFGSVSANENKSLSDEAWDWQLSDLDGNEFILNDFRGKTVFINFWATWCPPCNAEMPGIKDLVSSCDEQVVFIIATNESKAKVAQHLEAKKWDLPVYFYEHTPSVALSASSLPTTIIINKKGALIHRSEGMRKWNDDEAKALLECL